MLVHLGRGVSVHGEDIIAMTDLQQEQAPELGRLLEGYRARGLLRSLGAEPKTLVICRDGRSSRKTFACLSGVGIRTLRRRAEERPWAQPDQDE